MPSASLGLWQTTRAATLDEIEAAHVALGGLGRGRRYATQQVNHAYVVLLSGQFQGFCRDLHSESAEFLALSITPATIQPAILNGFVNKRKLDSGNPTPGNIGEDFGKLGIEFWPTVKNLSVRNRARQGKIDQLNLWRNAIAHQDFTKVGLNTALGLTEVRGWRNACSGLAQSFDKAMFDYLLSTTGVQPW